MYYNSRHGGDLIQAELISGVSKNKLIDLSTNINPLGVPNELKRYLQENIDDVMHYPDLQYRNLYSNLENFSGLPQENIIAGNGASEIINLFVATLKPKKVLIVHPTYGEYERESLKFNANVDYYVPANGISDMLELKARIPKYDAVFLCNPNNPTGTLLERISLLELLPKLQKTWLFIDESFMDFVTDGTRYSLRMFTNKAKIFILHSLTKLFAVPGLRIGCGYGPADLITSMKELQIPWSINSLAANSIVFGLNNIDFIEQTRLTVQKYREKTMALLAEIPKISFHPSVTNFLLLNISNTSHTSSLLQMNLLKKKFLVRNGNTFPGLKEDFIRIAIKNEAIMQNFVSTLEKVIKSGETL